MNKELDSNDYYSNNILIKSSDSTSTRIVLVPKILQ